MLERESYVKLGVTLIGRGERRHTFNADWPVIMDVAVFNKVTGVAQCARVQTLMIYTSQLDGAVVVRCTFHV